MNLLATHPKVDLKSFRVFGTPHVPLFGQILELVKPIPSDTPDVDPRDILGIRIYPFHVLGIWDPVYPLNVPGIWDHIYPIHVPGIWDLVYPFHVSGI